MMTAFVGEDLVAASLTRLSDISKSDEGLNGLLVELLQEVKHE